MIMAVRMDKDNDAISLPDRAIMEIGVSVVVHFIASMMRERKLVRKLPVDRRRDKVISES